MQTGEKNFLQAVLQDAEDQLRVLAFLLRHAQQHAPVRPGILGERGVGLVRDVPCMTQVLLQLQQLGVDVPASAYTVEQAADLLAPLLKGGRPTC